MLLGIFGSEQKAKAVAFDYTQAEPGQPLEVYSWTVGDDWRAAVLPEGSWRREHKRQKGPDDRT
jgi:hypothetical protein